MFIFIFFIYIFLLFILYRYEIDKTVNIEHNQDLSAMWKQTNLGYLRVDRLGCRLRRLASEGEPSLFDSVLDSTPRENTSVKIY